MESDLPRPEAFVASVVVACRNEIDHIQACLHSILHQEDPPGGIEVLVADGMSDDGTRGISFVAFVLYSGGTDHRPLTTERYLFSLESFN